MEQLGFRFLDEVRSTGKDYLSEFDVMLDQIISYKKGGVLSQEVQYPHVMKELIFLPAIQQNEILEFILRKITSSSASMSGEHQDTEFVTEFFSQIAKHVVGNRQITIADITSGLGFTQRRLINELEVTEAISYELKEVLVRIQQKLALLLDLNVVAEQRNIVSENVDESVVDLVVYSAPIAGKVPAADINLDESVLLGEIKTTEVDLLCLDRAMRIVKPGGHVLTLLSAGFLFKGGSTQKVRESLLKEAHVKAIITMPSNSLMPYAGVSTCMLLLQKKAVGLVQPKDVIMADFSHVKLDRKLKTSPVDIDEFNELCQLIAGGMNNGN
ncbi:N-6 DNA methylase [Paenibacillus sp. IITD108]|uniref:N-6 DNA methylase n=1 Tax=Paenibacillus sp. IITD108 TaxID=3116649 RepID=UPI002F41BA56